MNKNYLISIFAIIILILIFVFIKLNSNVNVVSDAQQNTLNSKKEIIPFVNTPVDKNILVDINNMDESMLSVGLGNSKIVNLS